MKKLARNHEARGSLLLFLILHLMSNYQSIAEEIQQNEMVEPNFAELLHRVSKQDMKISNLEVKGEQQERKMREEMSSLKSTVYEDKREIHFLKNRVALLEASVDENQIHDSQNVMKRPARLLPARILYGENNKTAENRFYGPPTSCSELSSLGYTLNGYYLIKNTNDEGSVKTVYCRFRQPQPFAEKLVKTYNKRKTIHFQVEKANQERLANGDNIFHFKIERVNIGRANLKNGVFTVSVAGLYHFQFTGVKESDRGDISVHLSVNGAPRTVAYAGAEERHLPISLSTSLQLKVGDKVNMGSSGPGHLHEPENNYGYFRIIFTGWLVLEDNEN